MKINWKVRLQSPAFWAGIIGVIATFAIDIAQLFGIDIAADVQSWQQALTALASAALCILALVGVVADPTTAGVSDSTQALTYSKPKEG